MKPVYIVGAGPGDPELITVKGARLLGEADVVVYAGSLIPPAVLRYVRPEAERHNSATLTRQEIAGILIGAARAGKLAVRLSSGDPSLYGAIAELMADLEAAGVPCEVVPGVSSFLAAAARLKKEFTVPGVSQTLILSRLAGRTPVPEAESLAALARHRASLCLFLSVHLIEEVAAALAAGYPPETPVAVVEKVTWPEERIIHCRLSELPAAVRGAGITRTALVLVGDFLEAAGEPSRLYDPNFSHGYRKRGDA
ncbi:cobalt-precorrin 4 C11-methyltransferase [Thermodesulfitimonas autotrophica]|uniref:Cobalt-precorrin 4 C11-methyltransferase n=1 Tax=Thermodesulfitimonas autotrophica TaxID=1894989 RepID=A0A3N5AD59_9THEO|nr:precorrin-4 C(11)-methyltransferase [Thermodesulfitimonas autotrophica]RPF42544.1 cobalt-precorrin 4 C11-methyltransferase [Thermodesulfitimonas autotrophica]